MAGRKRTFEEMRTTTAIANNGNDNDDYHVKSSKNSCKPVIEVIFHNLTKKSSTV
jgi:hypothetical protein